MLYTGKRKIKFSFYQFFEETLIHMEFFLAHITEDGRKQTVLQHLESTVQRCSTSARAFCAAEQGELAGLAHDLGKYSNGFQNRLLHDGRKVDHATAGAFECFKPVSYTHLDVYKRQGKYLPLYRVCS